MWENQQEEEKFRKEVDELRRLVWLDICASTISEDLMSKVDEPKFFELVHSRNWVIVELKAYLKENVRLILKEEIVT